MLTRLALLIGILLAPSIAVADCTKAYPSPWYWSVTGSSPSTQVWAGDSGAFVALADATYVAWVAAGCTATTIDTTTSLNAVLNGLSLSRVTAGQSWGANAINSAVDVTLTNPLNFVQLVTFTAGSKSLTLPQMNLTNSLPIGAPLTIKNVGSNNFTLKDFSGATLYTIHPGEVWTGINYSNATTSGTLQWWLSIDPQNFTNPFWSPQFGGTGANLSATGGTQQFLRQNSSGGAVDVVRPACATLSDSAASCATDATNASNLASGTVPAARLTQVPGWQGGYVAGRYYSLTGAGGPSNVAVSANVAYFYPIVIGETHTFDRIGIAVGTAGTAGNIRLAIYNNSGGQPTSLALDAGAVAVSGTGTKAATISKSLAPGVYWLAVAFDGTETVTGSGATQIGWWSVTGASDMNAPDPQLTATLTCASSCGTAFPATAFTGAMGAATYTAATAPVIGLRG